METFKSPIAFAQQREDPHIDSLIARMVLKRKKFFNQRKTQNSNENMKVLLVGSGGCTALSLLSILEVDEIFCVDINPAQIQLCKLKLLLLQYVPFQDFHIKLLGGDSNTSEDERLKLYEELKEKHIPKDLPGRDEFFKFWDANLHLIKIGPNRAGIYEEFFREISSKFASKGIDIIKNPEEALCAKKEIWDSIFAQVFDVKKLIQSFGENAVNFSKSQSFADHFSGVFKNAISKYDSTQNYFLHSIWKDGYYFSDPKKISPNGEFSKSQMVALFQEMDSDSDGYLKVTDFGKKLNSLGFSLSKEQLNEIWGFFASSNPQQLLLAEFIQSIRNLYVTGESQLSIEADEALWELVGMNSLPPYLQQNVQKRLRNKWNDFSSKIHWHQGTIEKLISELGEQFGPFHVIQTSNVTDWMPVKQCNDLMATCYKHLVDGGAVICRRLNGDYNLESVVAENFAVDSSLNKILVNTDRSFFYSEVVVGWKTSNTDLLVFNQLWNPLKPINSYSVATPVPNWLSPSALTSLPSFDSAVSFMETVYDFTSHPYFVWLRSPTATKDQVLQSLIPFAFAVEQWSQAVAAVISQMEVLEKRIHIVENLSEEHGHLNLKKAHKFTFYEFLESLGGDSDSFLKECPIHVQIFNQSLANFCKTHSAFAGGACLGIIESLYVNISEMICKVIFGRGWVREGQQHHYDIHAELDVDHARELLNVARPGWNENSPSLKKEISVGFLIGAQSFWQLYGNMFVTLTTSTSSLSMSQEIPILHEQKVPEISIKEQKKEISNHVPEQSFVTVDDLGDPFVVGLRLLANDPSKILLFQKVSDPFLYPNIRVAVWFENNLHKNLYEEDGWIVQQHNITGWLRLLDPSKHRQAWGSKEGFKLAFIALLQSRDLLEDIKMKTPITIKSLKTAEDFQTYSPIINKLEKGVKYPLGNDFFEIDHGKNYFGFFQRLGTVHYRVVMDGSNVCAVACGVIRSIRDNKNNPTNAWYLCDLKVFPNYRNQRISTYLMIREIPKGYWTCSRGYLISMNPEGGPSKNRVVSSLKRFKWAPFSTGPQLNLYSLSSDEMKSFATKIEKFRGKLSYLSLQGIKDIVLQSTGKPMPLLHVQFGPCATQGQYNTPQEGAVHMFCTPEDNPLDKACKEAGLKPTATASILHHRMSNWDWSFILTSDI